MDQQNAIENAERKEYHRPELRRFGRVADLTAGGSTGGREDKAKSRNKRA